MFPQNETRNEIDDEMLTFLKWLLTIISALITAGIGIILGAVVGFYGLYYFCTLMGKEAVQAGWPLLFITIPVGVLVGGILGGAVPFLFHAKWK